ncbi:hypothetical protein CHU95_13085 [Niveispirillum lacus]|uniref:Twin-arginine translocation pathway signal n=1 Tax=Niveispirillum lacus TaxID=1981099 RepID=A0A255YW03_9PROT|nr:DUF1501 domain-containing protein [Niveispirillum lacus]OYQ33359.1 hypothetical protein CHU95_13085 [Niveispirillum lacus]
MMLHRRHFIATASATGLLSATAPRLSLAAAGTDRRLVLIVLRGAMDGLGAVIPYADPDYRPARGALALAEPGQEGGVLDLDGRFGLHPVLAPLHEWWGKKQLLAVHAIATPYRDRSHFDAQDLLDTGGIRAGDDSGWLNRALARLDGGGKGLGLSLGQGVPLVLRGSVPVASWAPSPLPEPTMDFMDRVAGLYRNDPVLGPALMAGLGVADMANGMDGNKKRDGGKDRLILAETAGRMLSDPAGPRIASLELSGWDTHVGQGAIQGRLANALGQLAETMMTLRVSMSDVWGQTLIAVVTEFGRTIRPNGTGGTDHGTAGVALLAGGALNGGRVLGEWPGLRDDKLYEGRDLAPTTDMRALLKAVLAGHLGVPAADIDRFVFPDAKSVPALPELVRA